MPSLKLQKNRNHKPVVLLVLDGFGLSKRKTGNAVAAARMPAFRSLMGTYPHTQLKADGPAVGLPEGEVGNSEAGHQTIGAGRPVDSDKVLIDKSIQDRSFFNNSALIQTVEHLRKHNSALHLMGLLTNSQSAHASMKHVYALLDFVKKNRVKEVYLHLFTDGRDTPPYHAFKLLAELESKLPRGVRIASVSGRFYAMDRNRNWKRTSLVYHAIAHGEGTAADSATEAIEHAYERGESDEFIIPTVIRHQGKVSSIKENDAVIFWNLRSDRARQLSKPFIQRYFESQTKGAFNRGKRLSGLLFVTLTEFGKQIDSAIAAYPHHEISGTLVEALRSLKQMYIAESEKYAHVTYFFNGGYDEPRFGEDRIRIPSHHVKFFDQVPEMRAKEIGDAVVKSVKKGYDFICANFANPDMVAHTGNYKATVHACEAVDLALAKIWQAVRQKRGYLLVTADHGNAEEVEARNGDADTHHNANPVPFCLAGSGFFKKQLRSGTLADIAPTVLFLLDIEAPKEMKGKKLLKK